MSLNKKTNASGKLRYSDDVKKNIAKILRTIDSSGCTRELLKLTRGPLKSAEELPLN